MLRRCFTSWTEHVCLLYVHVPDRANRRSFGVNDFSDRERMVSPAGAHTACREDVCSILLKYDHGLWPVRESGEEVKTAARKGCARWRQRGTQQQGRRRQLPKIDLYVFNQVIIPLHRQEI